MSPRNNQQQAGCEGWLLVAFAPLIGAALYFGFWIVVAALARLG